MRSFLSRFHALVLFTLSGFDHLCLCDQSRLLNHARGVQSYCYQQQVNFKDFPAHAESLTKTLRDQTSQQLGKVPLKYFDSPTSTKKRPPSNWRNNMAERKDALLGSPLA